MGSNKNTYSFEYEEYLNSDALSPADKALVEAARKVTADAYAPYSHFNVGAVALLKNGQTINGTNQENASYPVTICAERVLMSAASVLHKDVPIQTMAITYHNLNGSSIKPASPCGMCRQALKEYEDRTKTPIRLLLTGMEGKVYVITQSSQLLPFSFGGDDLK
ncbi:MAG TPA: cytidine deaminase [Ferruginibacter sp.]|nr:cytidine deaminase [Ferruginibacter sp.]HRE62446.1 cytidine deaminase [Ferruginibacter sp.]